MLVQEVMTPEPLTVMPGTRVKVALQRLAEHGITALPVVDARRRLLGIVSEADLIREAIIRDPRAPEGAVVVESLYPARLVEDVYTRPAAAVRMDDDVASAVDLMTATGAKSLPVLDEHGTLVGVLSRSDVVRTLARADDVIAADLDDVLSRLGHADWLVEVDDGVVDVSGPANLGEASLAHLVARTVPGVVQVHVE